MTPDEYLNEWHCSSPQEVWTSLAGDSEVLYEFEWMMDHTEELWPNPTWGYDTILNMN